MSANSSKVLTPKEAARRIFDTTTPNDQQVGVVIQLMKLGALKRSSAESWTTSIEAVADYLAKLENSKASSQRQGVHGTTPLGPKGESVSNFYQGLIKEYFLAVVMKRGVSHQTAIFQRLVIGTQAVLLSLGVSVLIYAGAMIVRPPFVPPEHNVVQNWLNNKYPKLEISSITPAANTPSAYIAKFRYQENGRLIESKLKLTLRNLQVENVDSSES